ncbi:MAG TPA: hypothetical protein VGJ21_18470 [Terracidiphilus sp.]|jgi:hypothetical protein
MSLKTWWGSKSGKAKTVTTLCVLIVVNTGLCFLIPSVAESLHLNGQDPMSGLASMVAQAFLDIVLIVVLIGVAIFWRPAPTPPGGRDLND